MAAKMAISWVDLFMFVLTWCFAVALCACFGFERRAESRRARGRSDHGEGASATYVPQPGRMRLSCDFQAKTEIRGASPPGLRVKSCLQLRLGSQPRGRRCPRCPTRALSDLRLAPAPRFRTRLGKTANRLPKRHGLQRTASIAEAIAKAARSSVLRGVRPFTAGTISAAV